MPHKRYQSPFKGYSRHQQKAFAELAIQEDLEFEEQIARARFGEESITSLLHHAHGSAPSEDPIEVEVAASDAPSPQTMTISELMADPTDSGEPATTRVVRGADLPDDRTVPPELERTPEHAAVTQVGRGATLEPEDPAASPRIARLDRLLAAFRRDR